MSPHIDRVPVIRNYRVGHVSAVIAESVHDPECAARALALCARFDAGDLATLPVEQVLQLLEEVAHAAGLDDLGLRVGARYHPADWGAYGYLFLNSPTVLQALKNWVRVTREEQQGAHAQLLFSGDELRLEYAVLQPASRRRRQDAEMTLAVLLQAVRVIAGGATVPTAVLFEHARPRNTAPHRAFFRAPLQFGMGVNAIVFERRLAALAVPNADPRLLRVIQEFVGDAREPRGQASLVELVQLALRPVLHSGAAGLAEVCRRLGMSRRSLQRGLTSAGSSFEACLAAVRFAVACQLLGDPDLEIKEIAFLLGYSGSPAFSRAFRVWAGVSPQQWRLSEAQVPASAT